MTTKKALDLLKSLNDGGGFKIDVPTWKLVKNKIKDSCPHMSEEELDAYCKEIASNGSMLAQDLEAQLQQLIGKIGSFMTAVPTMVTTATVSVASCAASPMSAPAAPGILGSAVSSAKSLKTTLIDILSQSVSLGVELPDALGPMIEMFKPILSLL